MLKLKKLVPIILTTALAASANVTVFAGTIPRECTPLNADERAVQITENIISPYLDEASDGLGYALACGRANTAVRKAVIANETEGYSYTDLSPIAQNAIRTVCDMRLRPEAYAQAEEELKITLADLLAEVQNGNDINEAREEVYTLIYKSKDADFNPADYAGIDRCYWDDVPAVDTAYFTVARKLINENQ